MRISSIFLATVFFCLSAFVSAALAQSYRIAVHDAATGKYTYLREEGGAIMSGTSKPLAKHFKISKTSPAVNNGATETFRATIQLPSGKYLGANLQPTATKSQAAGFDFTIDHTASNGAGEMSSSTYVLIRLGSERFVSVSDKKLAFSSNGNLGFWLVR